MSAQSNLESVLHHVQSSIPQQRADQNQYLSELRKVLDLYLINYMEDEDPLYNILSRPTDDSKNYENFKVISPFNVQLNMVMTLPLQHSKIQVVGDKPGYVKLKLPENMEGEMQSCAVWRDACYRGIQKSLLRHIDAWTDEDNIFKQTVFVKWLAHVVDRALVLCGNIPNYKIGRLQNDKKIILEVEDLCKGFKISVSLLPVLAFQASQLPEKYSGCVLPYPDFDQWMAESCSYAVPNDQLWSISLWQHERKMIDDSNLEPMLNILESLRDAQCRSNEKKCLWSQLTNYRIQTLLMHSAQSLQTTLDGGNQSQAELLSSVLLQLRDRLVTPEGLPFFWDAGRDLFCGLTGPQRAELARSVTRVMKNSLEDIDTFRLETYALGQYLADNETVLAPELASGTGIHTPPSHFESPPAPHCQTGAQTQQSENRGRGSHNNGPDRVHHNGSGMPELDSFDAEPEPNRFGGQTFSQAQGDNDWWQIGITIAGVLGTAVVAGAALSKYRNKKE